MADKKKVIVIGGGFGGIFAAKSLEKLGRGLVDVELINNNNYFVFQPLLPEVASSNLNASDAVVPLRQLLKRVQVRQARVMGIDFDRKVVIVIQGARMTPVELPYDELVIALGTGVDLDRIPGMADHALTMKDLTDADVLRTHAIGCLETADVTTDRVVKDQLLTFVVVGAGFSGVETAAELNELITRALRYYRNIKREDIRMYLVEFAPRILPTFPAELADYATENLRANGIEVLTGVGTKSATATGVELTDGRIINTSTVVATIGNGPHPLVQALGLDMHWGRIRTDRYMQVPGHDHVWALGDAALIPLNDDPKEDPADYATQTAQFAVREGSQLAANLVAKLKGEEMKPFAYKSKGSLASLGMSKAVADVYGVKMSGILAWLLWRGFYLSFLPGFIAKLRVGLNWLINAVMPPNIVQLRIRPPATRYIHFWKGDKVFEPGMLIDGFYTVVNGRFKLTIDNPETGEHFEKEFRPGDHFGERVLLRSHLRTGLVEALEDGLLLFTAQKDFRRFARAFPALREYFKGYIEETFGGTDKAFAPGNVEDMDEKEPRT
ncbi:FAD-dependent oxidoreductase [Methyloceanibacter sp.]|uniref:FAD-dependent oxidoreductase n=1 Tax=Methyloceanibacter sp. TaxID=1965321 RepID=UPI00208A8C04|nr:FAD-dependent oxidoreductase [Methyloceanibacter sp.]GFO80925.1 MAG: nucleotide-disulfide oxidoreductase [Methyloceanibacter sp.]HML91382.1 FAD-dependent oxidoreductase [Methyloceanibacter sp.]